MLIGSCRRRRRIVCRWMIRWQNRLCWISTRKLSIQVLWFSFNDIYLANDPVPPGRALTSPGVVCAGDQLGLDGGTKGCSTTG